MLLYGCVVTLYADMNQKIISSGKIPLAMIKLNKISVEICTFLFRGHTPRRYAVTFPRSGSSFCDGSACVLPLEEKNAATGLSFRRQRFNEGM